MTVREVKRWLEGIRVTGEVYGDLEAAHMEEDRLYETVLRAVAEGKCDDPREVARAALGTETLNYVRTY
jgi:hypothetical protein